MIVDVHDTAVRASQRAGDLSNGAQVILLGPNQSPNNDTVYLPAPLDVRPVGEQCNVDNFPTDIGVEHARDIRFLDGDRLVDMQLGRLTCAGHGLLSYLVGAPPLGANRTIRPTLAFPQVSILTEMRQRGFASAVRRVLRLCRFHPADIGMPGRAHTQQIGARASQRRGTAVGESHHASSANPLQAPNHFHGRLA